MPPFPGMAASVSRCAPERGRHFAAARSRGRAVRCRTASTPRPPRRRARGSHRTRRARAFSCVSSRSPWIVVAHALACARDGSRSSASRLASRRATISLLMLRPEREAASTSRSRSAIGMRSRNRCLSPDTVGGHYALSQRRDINPLDRVISRRVSPVRMLFGMAASERGSAFDTRRHADRHRHGGRDLRRHAVGVDGDGCHPDTAGHARPVTDGSGRGLRTAHRSSGCA